LEYTYDALGRVSQQVTKQGETTVLTESFTYTTVNGNTSAQIATYTTVTAAGTTTYSYTYDGNGNILSVSDGVNTTSYVYDKQNQLVRENNQAGGFTHTWAYDNAGNIQTRTEYAYTTGTLGTPTDSVTYTYADETWGDLLTAYDGAAITYDGIGNPNALDGWSFTWEHGRELVTMSNGTTTWTNTYNADGLRTKRTNGTTTYSYVYTGSSLLSMTVSGNTLYFNYDAAGTPLTVTYNGTTYYYATNLQGDVVAILDSTGNTVVSYTYDAWGNPISTTGSLATTLGQYNPLRYRGYVYDIETSLYYLQTRYYNPRVCRFLNADGYTCTNQGFTGNNTFTYCGNNPVTNSDHAGMLHDRTAGGGAGGGYVGGGYSGGRGVPGGQLGQYFPSISNTPSNATADITVPLVITTTYAINELRAETIAINKRNRNVARTITQNETIVVEASKSKSSNRYWSATIKVGYVDVGRPLTFNQAVHEVSAGRNVFTVTYWEAEAVARTAGGQVGANNQPLFPEIHHNGDPGYYYHYYTYNRKGGHVFYLFGGP